jgi:hypothetical protein
MLVQALPGALYATGIGGSLPVDSSLQYLANLPAAPNADPPVPIMWRGDRGTLTVPSSGNLQWKSILGNKTLSGAAVAIPTRSEAFNSKSTYSFGTFVYDLDTVADVFDSTRNTVFVVCQVATAGLRLFFGPSTEPTPGAPTDNVLALGWNPSGNPILVTNAGNASLLIGGGDIRGAPHVLMATMSPEHGKSIWVDGVENNRNLALVTPLANKTFSFGAYGNDPARFQGDIRSVLVIPGQDYSDPYFDNARVAVTEILMDDAGI